LSAGADAKPGAGGEAFADSEAKEAPVTEATMLRERTHAVGVLRIQ
jgi:hypothetical protein